MLQTDDVLRFMTQSTGQPQHCTGRIKPALIYFEIRAVLKLMFCVQLVRATLGALMRSTFVCAYVRTCVTAHVYVQATLLHALCNVPAGAVEINHVANSRYALVTVMHVYMYIRLSADTESRSLQNNYFIFNSIIEFINRNRNAKRLTS